MTIPIVQTTAITDTGASNITSLAVTLPSGVAVDDIIIIIGALDGGPTGFNNSGGIDMTEFGLSNEGNVTLVYLWGRAVGGETSQTITWTQAQQGRFFAIRISGCITTEDPRDVTGASNANSASTTNVCTAITSTVVDTLAICAVAVDRDRVDSDDGFSDAQGFASFVPGSGSSGGANGAGIIIGSKDLASIGGSLAPTFGTWASDQNISRMFNLKPPEGAAGPIPGHINPMLTI